MTPVLCLLTYFGLPQPLERLPTYHLKPPRPAPSIFDLSALLDVHLSSVPTKSIPYFYHQSSSVNNPPATWYVRSPTLLSSSTRANITSSIPVRPRDSLQSQSGLQHPSRTKLPISPTRIPRIALTAAPLDADRIPHQARPRAVEREPTVRATGHADRQCRRELDAARPGFARADTDSRYGAAPCVADQGCGSWQFAGEAAAHTSQDATRRVPDPGSRL